MRVRVGRTRVSCRPSPPVVSAAVIPFLPLQLRLASLRLSQMSNSASVLVGGRVTVATLLSTATACAVLARVCEASACASQALECVVVAASSRLRLTHF